MAVAAIDTQQGATLTLGTDGLTLRIVSITGTIEGIKILPKTYLGSTTKMEWFPGELADYDEVTVVYQNSPGLANPSKVIQTITVTGPTATGASVPESVTGTAFCHSITMLHGFDSQIEGLQLKTFKFKWDGGTGPTRTVSS
jgi:hypothetical protein